MTYFVGYVATAAVFFILDFIWLGTIARDFYRGQLGHLLLDQFKIGWAALFYAIYVVGLMIFAVAPAMQEGSWRPALIYGALFGFFTYATYDFTNLATLRGWPLLVVAVDITWGVLVSGTSALLGWLAVKALYG